MVVVARIAGVTAVVTACSYLVPPDHSATAVGLVFLAATYLFVWRKANADAALHGLSLGGLFDPQPIDPRRLLRAVGIALACALVCFAIVAVPFFEGFKIFRHVPLRPFHLAAALPSLDEVMGQLLVIAFPEEAFFRGYVQTEITRQLEVRRVRRAEWIAIVVTSAIFAVGHLLTKLDPARLAVFFPSLLFGLLRKVTRGVGAGTVFHAACNLLSASVSRGFGLS